MIASRRPLVLCYHAISDSWPDSLSVSPAAFERQLRTLVGRGLRPATVDDVLAGGARLLHVTFDDAFRSVRNALPALEALGVPATVFACPGFADEGRPLDVPELLDEVRAYPGELATMTWNELRELAERGVSIGSHTVSHPHLCELSDADLRRELEESRARIEDEIRRPCRVFGYPYGEQDARTRAAARAAGYTAAFGLGRGSSPDDRFAQPRVGIVRADGIARMMLKISPLAGPIGKTVRAVNRRGGRGARRRSPARPG